MALSREKIYYKAVRQAITAACSSEPLKDKLNTIVRAVSRCFDAGASIILLDANRTHLIHTASWKLPPYYVHKGLLEIPKSLNEFSGDTPLFIEDAAHDPRLQYPELAAKAGITSILAMPVISEGQALGTLRVYFKTDYPVNNQDESFIRAMSGMVALALCRDQGKPPVNSARTAAVPESAAGVYSRQVHFAHPSEEEFARLLDYYNIEWIYEPRSFPLEKRNQPASEMFTPDFYLPVLDLYVELTTMKQSLVTQKNRKLRRLKELYPEIKITLLYKNDYDRLLAKYGVGPLAQSRAHSLRRVLFTASEIDKRVRQIAAAISHDYEGQRPVLIGVQRGFLCFMADLMRQITVPLDIDFMAISYYGKGKETGVRVTKDVDTEIAGRHIILVEDIVDTGITLNYILNYLKSKNPASLKVCTLLDRRARRLVDIQLEYTGFEVPDEFVVGYGLDYREEYRNLPFIAIPEIDEVA